MPPKRRYSKRRAVIDDDDEMELQNYNRKQRKNNVSFNLKSVNNLKVSGP